MPTVTSFEAAGKIIAKLVDTRSRTFLASTWKDLVSTTPVLTGKARASWFVSPQKPTTREIPDGTYQYPSLDLAKYGRNYSVWYITNTAPYIDDLNEGSSLKAPAGFVQAAIQKNIVKANG